MSIVVTAATGQLGSLVIEELLKRVPANKIVAVVRDTGKAADIARRGVQVKIANYDNPASLREVFRPGDTVLLISGNEFGKRTAHHLNVIDAAKAAQVARIAYTSVLGAFLTSGFSLPEEQHKGAEEAILSSNITYTILRNGWYTENYTDHVANQLAHGMFGAAGDGRVGSATRRDFAAAAAVVLTGTGHENKIYELSGDTAWTFEEYVAVLSKQSRNTVSYRHVTQEALADIYTESGLPREQAEAFAESETAIKRGLLEGGGGDLSRLISRPTTLLEHSIKAALDKLKKSGETA